MSDLTNLLGSVDKSGRGVCVQASTLGSLEALLEFLRVSKIPVRSSLHLPILTSVEANSFVSYRSLVSISVLCTRRMSCDVRRCWRRRRSWLSFFVSMFQSIRKLRRWQKKSVSRSSRVGSLSILALYEPRADSFSRLMISRYHLPSLRSVHRLQRFNGRC